MNQFASRCLLALALGVATTAHAELTGIPSGAYGLDKTHGYITFSYNHLGFSNPHVGFDAFDVALELNSDDPTSSQLSVTIDAASINSRVANFDDHLNGEKFFDTANHPEITFTSNEIISTGENTFDVAGDLVIRGVSKPVTLAATINKAAMHPMRKIPTIGVSAKATVNRSDWDLGQYAPAVSDEVELMIEVELPQQTD